MLFENSGEEPITRMNTGKCTEEITADQFIKIFPNQLS
jgi:hypothetical protein